MPKTFNQLWPGIFLLVAALAAASEFAPAEARRPLVPQLIEYDGCTFGMSARPCEPEPGAAR